MHKSIRKNPHYSTSRKSSVVLDRYRDSRRGWQTHFFKLVVENAPETCGRSLRFQANDTKFSCFIGFASTSEPGQCTNSRLSRIPLVTTEWRRRNMGLLALLFTVLRYTTPVLTLIKRSAFFLILCIYIFDTNLTIKSDYFLDSINWFPYNCDRNWIVNYHLDELWDSKG
jgi:hypothetical protein